MTSVIRGLVDDENLKNRFDITSYGSCIDGNILIRFLYSIIAYIVFLTKINNYDLFHVNVASKGSSFRKALYVRAIKKHGKKVVLHVHGGAYLKFYDGLRGNKKNIIDRLWKQSDLIVVLSDEWKSNFLRRFPYARIEVIENGIDTEIYKKAVKDLTINKYNIAYLGRIEKEKGVYELIDAFESIVKSGCKSHLYIAGTGSLRQLQEYVENKNGIGNKVTFCGWIDEQKKIELLKKCSIVVLPSYNEALPLCVLEGMASGKAIIATSVGAIPSLITSDHNGLLISPGSAEQLASAFQNVFDMIEKKTITGRENIKVVEEKYSWHRMHALFENVYERVGEK